jgi:beta-galactosidase
MLDHAFSFPAINLQNPIPAGTRAIVLACAECLHADVQQRLLEFARAGGRLLLYGALPTEDLEGRPCTTLVDALRIKLEPIRHGSPDYFVSLKGLAWAKDEPEIQIWQVRPFRAGIGEPFLGLVQTDFAAAATIPCGSGTVIVVTAQLPLHKSLWRGIWERMGARPLVEHDAPYGGVLLNRVRHANGARFISLINLDQEEKDLTLKQDGRPLFPIPVHLPGRKAKLLPLGVTVGGVTIRSSTAEIAQAGHGVAFKQGPVTERIEVEGRVRVEGAKARAQQLGGTTQVDLEPGRGVAWLRPIG